MFNFLENEKYKLKEYQPLVNQINLLETSVKNYTDIELKEQFDKLRKEYFLSQNFSNDIIARSFSLTREAAFRTIGLRPFDQQLLGGLVLNSGKITEMKTCEGKTLVATLPAALNAISGRGVHIVTVNDYLAKRDSTWMGQIYDYLGLTVGLVQSQMESQERKDNYFQDITYITNSELGFDYLRDNQVKTFQEMVQRKFNYCIIDEVDAILIDEARTPLVLSIPDTIHNPKIYLEANTTAKSLIRDVDFKADEKTKNITFTDIGIDKIEYFRKIPNIYGTNAGFLFYLQNAISANIFFRKNSEYIIENNKIAIVDEFTGRVMPDRRWSNGLHEAIEAKESIDITQTSRISSSITYQNFFTLYPKLAGMTGTAKSAALELESIYNLEVVVIPTSKKFQRKDLPDKVYTNDFAKWKAIAKECFEIHKTGRPILVGTSSIEKSDFVSFLLENYKLQYNVLNARPENLKYESEIVGEAGCLNAITIATNMAGRGTDIILGGSPGFKIIRLLKILVLKVKLKEARTKKGLFLTHELYKELQKERLNYDAITQLVKFETEFDKKQIVRQKKLSTLFFYLKINYKSRFKNEKQYINQLGGLYVIGTERQDSKRIDNQLRGRAGRQGDAGSSRFFVSIEDKIFRLFGDNKFSNLFNQLNLTNEEISLESDLITKTLDNTQERVENYYYDIRKQVYDYDELITEQRKTFYLFRSKVLKTQVSGNLIIASTEDVIKKIVKSIKTPQLKFTNLTHKQENQIILEDFEQCRRIMRYALPPINLKQINASNHNVLFEFLMQEFWISYDIHKTKAFSSIGEEYYKEYERSCVLESIDHGWSTNLEKMETIRESIVWRVYAQKDPLAEYKKEGFSTFRKMDEEMKRFLVFAVFDTDFYVT